MPYIYATALTGDIVKIGRGTSKCRALAAQMYHVETIRVLAMWETDHAHRDEKRALRACAHWHARGELFKVPTAWLEAEHPVVTLLTKVLGLPLPTGETPQWRRHGGVEGARYKTRTGESKEERRRRMEAQYPQLAAWQPKGIKLT